MTRSPGFFPLTNLSIFNKDEIQVKNISSIKIFRNTLAETFKSRQG